MKNPASKNWPRGLRSRLRADQSTRLWWEPTAPGRAAGLANVELDGDRLSWSVGRAAALNADQLAKLTGDQISPDRRQRSIYQSVSALIGEYKRSRFFRDKADATRASYNQNLAIIERYWGPKRVRAIGKAAVNEWFESYLDQGKKTQATRLVAMLSILMSHAERCEWLPAGANPCLKLGGTGSHNRRSRIATPAELKILLSTCDATGQDALGTFVCLAVWTGQRATDLRQARRQDFRLIETEAGTRWCWDLHQSKRGTSVPLFIHEQAVSRLAGTMIRDARPEDAFLIHPLTGEAWSQENLSKAFSRLRETAACELPSIADLQFRDLRRTFGVWATIGGATISDIAAVLGNSADTNADLAARYAPPAVERTRRAVEAVTLPKKRD